jgi:predicted helicase
VSDTLLPRICGQELMLPAVVLAQLLFTARLDASGFRFTRPGKLQLSLGNTLCEPRIGDTWLVQDDRPFTVVLGNPPFSGVSENRYPWISKLLRGRAPGDRAAANYFRVDGQPLREKKHWLEDDYVKFLRLAHWLIERASAGVVGFVTNHGFLDNTTFRGMRQQLLRTFPRVTVVDLHGNTRTGERAPQDGHNESVFGIEQGVAISLWRRPVHGSLVAQIEHVELWGQRTEKLLALDDAQPLPTTRLEPHAPYYFLVPRDRRGEAEYMRGYPLSEIMPVNSTAAVTARDSFVVAFSAAELSDRIMALCSPDVSDDDLRRQYFTSSRSAKYLPGDTRGWQLARARQRLRDEPAWARYIRDCLYRPFDRRQIFWAPWMIDWPRDAVMTHMLEGDNLALVARRQIPASHECNYVWVTDTIALDGLIRSDNRGSESVFPLFLREEPPALPLFDNVSPAHSNASADHRAANFAADFLARCAAQLQLAWNPAGGTEPDDQFTPRQLFHYVYALLHAPSYRARFAAALRIDFPRVFIPSRRALFRQLSALGAQLVERHLLRDGPPGVTGPAADEWAAPEADAQRVFQVDPRGPQLVNGRIHINDQLSIGPVPTAVWEFRVGVHQVCHKWLKDRRGRSLDATDLAHYRRILASVRETLVYMQQIDQAIAAHGGWTAAFA